MKHPVLSILLLLSCPLTSVSSAAGAKGEEQVFAAKGRLGIPLKTEATVEAEVVRAEDAGRKDLAGEYLLRVRKVDGVEIHPAQVFKFSTAVGVPRLPADAFALYQQKTGKTVDELPADELKRAEKDFVGKKLTYLASEVVNPPKAGERKNAGKLSSSTLLLARLLEQP